MGRTLGFFIEKRWARSGLTVLGFHVSRRSHPLSSFSTRQNDQISRSPHAAHDGGGLAGARLPVAKEAGVEALRKRPKWSGKPEGRVRSEGRGSL